MGMTKKLKEIFEICLNKFLESKIFVASIMSAVYAFAILFLVFCVIKFVKWCWFF